MICGARAGGPAVVGRVRGGRKPFSPLKLRVEGREPAHGPQPRGDRRERSKVVQKGAGK